ncbi:predicted protein [Thalassiosira pseudonana CCMP1335]|jgi:hypothetical protein|uniref:Uncharacterized protein n=1 Tax=Thalassiosira pseudonana TaxID=35128 RepID=B8CF22_THAPS|nr:predicted protein [Thalassiosira pseudonana CCMP1335]EED88003.1 predicted protein [Thalassiosira pseudonana CCMP1335]|eukprot:scaffold944_cov115-Alexandrium_tamarense.AAC.34
MALIPHPTREENAAKWYTEQDKDYFKAVVTLERNQFVTGLQSRPLESFTSDELVHCVGLENYLSRNVNQRVRETKKRHTKLLLREQARQSVSRRMLGDDDWSRSCGTSTISSDTSDSSRCEERLARLSEASSQWSRERAHRIAAGYRSSVKF